MITTRVTDGNEINISKEFHVVGAGAIVIDMLNVHGIVRVIDQCFTISEITKLDNATNVYVTSYDGTNTVDITADGAVISGFLTGSFFHKDKDAGEILTALNSSQVRVEETITSKKAGKPFVVVQKKETDTFIRLHITTTDNPIDFRLEVNILFAKMCGWADMVFI